VCLLGVGPAWSQEVFPPSDERERALEAAQVARSEAERAVSTELSRLITLEARVGALRDKFRARRLEVTAQRDAILGWHRRVMEARASGPAASDAMYQALRKTLRTSRDELSLVLWAMSRDQSRVPPAGPEPHWQIPQDISTEEVYARRALVELAIAEARDEERGVRDERAALLIDETRALNRERLGLLNYLSPAKRQAITGFSAAGRDQARSELRQLSLILRFHQHMANAWVAKVKSGADAQTSVWSKIRLFLPVLLVVFLFVWIRRKGPVFLQWGLTRLAGNDRVARHATPSVGLRILRIVSKTRHTLEWILLCVGAFFILPAEARDLLEVQLVASVASWTLMGSFVIHLVNALAADRAATGLTLEETGSGKLRLRSLRLVGLTVVVFALCLRLSGRLVGHGTIHNWIFATCWFAAIPVFLVLVHWWRPTVFKRFDRLDSLSKKAPLTAWILANRTGYKSFFAAMIGAVQLFLMGTVKIVGGWVSRFDLTRRIHAYFFRREIDRIGEGKSRQVLIPLNGEPFSKLDPEMPFLDWHSCPADTLREKLVQRAMAEQGGLIVVVAARGMGKSSLLRAVAEQVAYAKILPCQANTTSADLQAVASDAPSLVLVDDVHTLIESRIGGFAKFDEVLAVARAHSERRTWVFAIDASVWPLLKRARDARPMFDERYNLQPWSERQIGELVSRRCLAGEINLHYEGLLERLPPGADEVDRLDAIRAKRVGYERMLWDHVGGNPGLALQAWRASLGQDPEGAIHVRPLQVPDITKLERLPDASLFVLRAVLQLAPTSAETVAQATRLQTDQVIQDLSFGKAQGFYEEKSGGIRIAWPWLRAVSRLLERRHLLVSV